jgi:hypothetical protein
MQNKHQRKREMAMAAERNGEMKYRRGEEASA